MGTGSFWGDESVLELVHCLHNAGRTEKPLSCVHEAGELQSVRIPSAWSYRSGGKGRAHGYLSHADPYPGPLPPGVCCEVLQGAGRGYALSVVQQLQRSRQTGRVWSWFLRGLGSLGCPDPTERPGGSPQSPL